MRRYSRVREKLGAAVYRLAVGEGDVRARLVSAHWVLNHLRADELPPELREQWESIMRRLTRHGPELYSGEVFRDAVKHTMSRIKNSTGRVIATDIYALYSSFVHAYGL
ncbi:hypothetical protein [Paraburkholderia sp. A1RO-5L]|uniref:hypothetical protein n=1 Tax=Paraburkholderia sp. A1RO-5L TaxID=3028370 RepID=UPI003B7C71C2